MPETSKRFNLIIDDDLHVKLKKKCAEQHISMSDAVRELLNDWVVERPKTVANTGFKGMRTSSADATLLSDLKKAVKNG